MRRVLVAGVGNIFFGDDGFGSEVAQRMAARSAPAGVRVVDFGIRGIDLAFELLDEPDAAILVDAVQRGGAPGTIYLIEADGAAPSALAPADGHGADPARVLAMVDQLGKRPGRVLVVGCEPAALGGEWDGRIGLSAPVEAAVDEAIRLIESLAADLVGAER